MDRFNSAKERYDIMAGSEEKSLLIGAIIIML